MTRRKAITVYVTPELAAQFERAAKRANKSLSKFIVDHMVQVVSQGGEAPAGILDAEALRQATREIVAAVRKQSRQAERHVGEVKIMLDRFAWMYLQHTPAPLEAEEATRRYEQWGKACEQLAILGEAIDENGHGASADAGEAQG